MSKDLSSDKQVEKYFDARNIRILATDQKSTFAITNEQGNELVFSVPSPIVNEANTSIDYVVDSVTKSLVYKAKGSVVPRNSIESQYLLSSNPSVYKTSGTQVIIGKTEMRDSALIVSTDNNGFDCFWELTNLNDGDFDLVLLYMGDLSLSSSNLVQVLYNYENSIIQKVYFVDGVHQLRFFNIRQSVANGDSINLIDLDPGSLDVVSTFNLSQAEILSVLGGGSHTSGVIQYSYGLYILNGAQTTPAPLSELVSIGKGNGLGGGDVNEVLGRSVSLRIKNIDQKFTHIKIYSIKYTSLNEIPEITIVADKEIDDFNQLSFTDDGSKGTSISLESFVFLGSNPIIPKHIATKDNRLFPVNISEQTFDVDLDCRSFSFNASAACSVLNDVYIDDNNNIAGGVSSVTSPNFAIPVSNDSINADYDVYKYQSNGSTFGASGKYVDIEVVQSNINPDGLQFLKDRELYRIGIKFYNRLGQTSLPKWVMDLKAPSGNISGNYNQLRVTLTSDFYTWVNDASNFADRDDIPVGYKVIRADRTLTDQTIYAQGFINPMVANYTSRNKTRTYQAQKDAVNSTTSDIIPSMTRMFQTMTPFLKCSDYADLATRYESDIFNSFAGTTNGSFTEGMKVAASADWRAQNFQHNRLMQFYSPDVLFRDNQIDSSYKLNVLGLIEQDYVANWATETNPISGEDKVSAKFLNGVTSSTPGVTASEILSRPDYLSDVGFYGPTNGENLHATHQVYRQFTGTYHPATGSSNTYDIYGSPELTQEGADFTAYNNDFKLRYSNNLKTMLLDDFRKSDQVTYERQILGMNTIGAKCITFAEGPDDLNYDVGSRVSIEQMHATANTGATNGVLLAEFSKDPSVFYVSGIYGGMTYESKRNASYIEIGKYNDINTNGVLIESPGDTFVGTFTFTKMVKTDIENKSLDFNTVAEIVSIRVETTVDLLNRNDLSLGAWDNRFQPKYEEYQKYNKVYSQQPTLIKSTDTGIKFKKIQEFDGRLMSSKEKIPGEFIDAWTDLLENETMDLDGKYGPINAVVNLKDEIFCLQDTGVAQIAINPRVQTPGGDGISLELGVGGVLHDYIYRSTTIGCLNKWGAIVSENAFYFVDVINKGIMTFDGSIVGRLSDIQGFHHELLEKMIYSDLSQDNPVLGKGLSLGYNSVNADIYFSFLQSKDSFTLGFNEKVGAFVSYYDYIPSWYISKGSVLLTTDQSSNGLWEHFKGLPNHFYGNHYKSSITLHIAPEGDEMILNNASYKMELTDQNGIEVLNKGLTGVRVYNDYQDSGVVSLVQRQNVFKKFRNWKINFPRNKGTRDRVRSSWGFAEFSFDNLAGNKLILHDITIYFTQH